LRSWLIRKPGTLSAAALNRKCVVAFSTPLVMDVNQHGRDDIRTPDEVDAFLKAQHNLIEDMFDEVLHTSDPQARE
jgi:hypothetical protein